MWPKNLLHASISIARRTPISDLVHLADRYLLVDTASRPGMSGAPVIRRSWGTHSLAAGGTSSNSTRQSKFVGVYSGFRTPSDERPKRRTARPRLDGT